ncbi:PEPxxWA-CTERM sorting domain-containing protein, partial [Roseateles sp.]|uniref:PEPxxWA-CTERM sorting domain-containing protein n=1 Tax=Roseateles sp. TaxID=1971397 RepID=UPI002F3ECBC8
MRSILRLSALPMLCALLAQIAMVPAVAATTFTAGYQYEMAVPGVNRADVWSGAVRPDSPLFYVESIVTPGGLPATGVTQLGGGGLATYGHVNSTSFGFTGMRTEFPNQSTYLHADTTNAMSDSFVIDCAGCTAGAIGSLSFRVYWGGGGLREVVTTVPGTALSGYVADINWSSSFQIRADGVPDPFPPDQPGPPNPGRLGLDYYFLETERNGERRIEESPRVSAGLQELSIRFVFGQPIHIDMSLRAAVLGAVYSGEDQTSSFDAIVNQISAYGQMYWDGITGVSTADGQRIDAFTAVNQVGVDYARSLELPILQIVPEPGTWALMLGGLALMGVVARRRVHALRTAMVETV